MRLVRWSPHNAAVALLGLSLLSHAGQVEKMRNDKVAVGEGILKPGEKAAVATENPTLLVYLGAGKLDLTTRTATRVATRAQEGGVTFEPDGIQEIRNTGPTPLQLLQVEFQRGGSPERWGRTGLSSHYKVLLENKYVRVYDIFIPANSNEPQHTHKDRIVVCLAGAKLTHLFPDGRTEVSTLKTGEIVWRKGSSHIGQNHSANNFHAIAIEPK